MKHVLLINDMASYGKVALSVMLPIFSHMKYETYSLPTALVSNTLDYGDFTIMDTTDYMKETIAVWDRLGFSFPLICTGFIVSGKQAEVIHDFCAREKARGANIFVDPIMGDDGHLYNGVPPETVTYMKKLCSIADLIVPNVTEASLLSGHQPKEDYTMDDIRELTDNLRSQGAKDIVITSIPMNGKKCNAVSTAASGDVTLLPYEEIPVRFPGTGDIFLSLIVGKVASGMPLAESVQKTMDTMRVLIEKNLNAPDKMKGIPIERYLDDLD
jgi:pyridoxine kinase